MVAESRGQRLSAYSLQYRDVRLATSSAETERVSAADASGFAVATRGRGRSCAPGRAETAAAAKSVADGAKTISNNVSLIIFKIRNCFPIK